MALPINAAVLLQALFVLLCVLQSTAELISTGNVTLDTPAGKIRGKVLLESHLYANSTPSPFYAFLGIPYAKPPVGELRFKPTEEPEKWEGTYDALVMPPACPQYAENPFPWYDTLPGHSEDCLYLNVWTPKNAVEGFKSKNDKIKRAVKLYIHGGGWFTGGASRMGYYDANGDLDEFEIYDEYYLEFMGLVVVTINYRLGALGFLSSGTDDAPGNAGLQDILTAMKWVHTNIASFGGDPDNIALFGQGAGAIAASYFLTVPSALPLFNKMVISGATIYTLKALKEATDENGNSSDNNIKLANRLAEAVGCGSSIEEKPKDTVDCLRGVDPSILVQTLASFSPVFQQPPNVFLPQFAADPFAFLKGKLRNIGKKQILLQFNGDEGSYLLTVNNPDVFGVFGEKDAAIDDVQAKSMLTKFLGNFTQPDVLAEELLGDLDKEPTVGNRNKVHHVMGLVNTICPIVYLADDLSKSKITAYVMKKRVDPPYNPWANWMGIVHFNNVQMDFVRESPFLVNGESYTPTYKQWESTYFLKAIVGRFLYEKKTRNPFLRKYNYNSRYHVIFDKDAEFFYDGGRNHRGLGGFECKTLRKYYVN